MIGNQIITFMTLEEDHMQKIQSLLVTVFITVFLLSMVACGGGGGGDSFTPVAYTGSAAPATINDTNASDFASLAESGSSMGGIAPIPLAVTSGNPADIPAPVLQSLVTLNKKLPDYLQNAPIEGSITLAETQSETQFCGIGDGSDGSMFVSATLDSSGSVTASITYSSCDEGFGVVLNGTMAVTMSDINADPFLTPRSMTMTYRNLEMFFQDISESITIYAVMSMVEDLTGVNPTYTMSITDLIMQESVDGLTARISNYILTSVDYLSYEEVTLSSVTSKARLYDHLLGYVEVYTVIPIRDAGAGPYHGVVRMEGANTSWAEVDFSVTCDAVTNNGTYFDGTTSGTFCHIPL